MKLSWMYWYIEMKIVFALNSSEDRPLDGDSHMYLVGHERLRLLDGQ
jgi:hypothetical protein